MLFIADRPKTVFDYWISPTIIRDAYPHLKLLLTLILLPSGRDDVNGFYLIAFPAKNRDVFIRGVVKNLLYDKQWEMYLAFLHVSLTRIYLLTESLD